MRPQAPDASGAAPDRPAAFAELLAELGRRHAAGALSPEALRASLALLAERHESEVSIAVARAVADATAKAGDPPSIGPDADLGPAQPRSSLALELGSALCGPGPSSDLDSDDEVDDFEDGGPFACTCGGPSSSAGAGSPKVADTNSTSAAGDGICSSSREGPESSGPSGVPSAPSSGVSGTSSDLGAGVWEFLFPGEEPCCVSAPERELSGATGLTSASSLSDAQGVRQPPLGPRRCRCCSRLCGLPLERGNGSGGLTPSRSSSSLDLGGSAASISIGAASFGARAGAPPPLRLAPPRSRAVPAATGAMRREDKGLPAHPSAQPSPQLLSDGASACSRGTESTSAPSDRHIPSCFCPSCSSVHDDD